MEPVVWIPLAWAGAYVVASTTTFVLYWRDKRAAGRQAWRTPEATLHLSELLGGWVGGLLARKLLRHKSRKLPFRMLSWAIIAVHLIAIGTASFLMLR